MNLIETDFADLKMAIAVGLANQHEMTFLAVLSAVVPEAAWVPVEMVLEECCIVLQF